MYVYLFYLRIIIPVSFIYNNIFIQNEGDTALQFAKKSIQENEEEDEDESDEVDEEDEGVDRSEGSDVDDDEEDI